MADKSGSPPISKKLIEFWQSQGSIPTAVREIVSVLGTVGIIVVVLFLICGTWPAIVTIESESMVPHMNVGDLVLVMKEDRLSPLQSMAEGNSSGYEKFGLPGDVIIYRPNGIVNYPRSVVEPKVSQNLLTNLSWDIRTLIGWNQVHPIIHRALVWVDGGQVYTTKDPYNQIITYTAPHAGYITKGDNNKVNDQVGFGNNYRGLGSSIEPIKTEWIVGKAVFSIPYIGFLPLHIREVIILVLLFMGIPELYKFLLSRRKEEPGKKLSKNKPGN